MSAAVASAAAAAPATVELVEAPLPIIAKKRSMQGYEILSVSRQTFAVLFGPRILTEYTIEARSYTLDHVKLTNKDTSYCYHFQPEKLSQNETHLIFPGRIAEIAIKALRAIEKIEHAPEMGQSVKIYHEQLDEETFLRCSFPKEFRDIAEKIIEAQKLKVCSHKNYRVLLADGVIVNIPDAANVIRFCVHQPNQVPARNRPGYMQLQPRDDATTVQTSNQISEVDALARLLERSFFTSPAKPSESSDSKKKTS